MRARLRYLSLFVAGCALGLLMIYGVQIDTDDMDVMKYERDWDGRAQSASSSNITVPCSPVKNVAVLKVHKTGSTTLVSIMHRFAYTNKLLVMVPAYDSNLFLGWPYKFVPNVSNLPAPLYGRRFNMLTNHVIFNYSAISPLMEKSARYISIVRHPLTHLKSAFDYFGVNDRFRLGYGQHAFEKFLSNPLLYDKNPQWLDQLQGRHVVSLTRNLQSADLGLEYADFDNLPRLENFISKIHQQISFFVILERFDESLVLLRRMLCWRTEDIVYITKNTYPLNWNLSNLSSIYEAKAYAWNNADLQLYRLAERKFNDYLREEGNIDAEVSQLRKINAKISKYCKMKNNIPELYLPEETSSNDNPQIKPQDNPQIKSLHIDGSIWNESFSVNVEFCKMLFMREEQFTLLFKCRQYPNHAQCRDKSTARFQA